MFDTLIRPDEGGGVGIAFTDREGGVSEADIGPLNLGRSDPADAHGDSVAAVAANLELVRVAVGVPQLVTVNQVHGREVLVVDDHVMAGWTSDSPLGTGAGARPLPIADAMVTTLSDVALVIRVADCVPVLFADPGAGVIGAAHAGREGLAAGVLVATTTAMRDAGARALTAWIGPHICGSCYEVDAAMAERVGSLLPAARALTPTGTPALDLGGAAAEQLENLGVEVQRLDPCTRTSPHLHSHRRDGARAGRSAGIIWRVSGAPSAARRS